VVSACRSSDRQENITLQKFSKGAAASWAAAQAMYLGMRKVPLSFWDVGARGGLSRPMKVLYRCGVIVPTFFEPDPTEASRLKQSYKHSTVFNCALSDEDGNATLYLAREPGCSSLLRPGDLLDIEIVDTQTVPVMRADTLLAASDPGRHPEMLKLDVQGGELAVLKGFGDFLDGVTCIETEVSLRKIYEEQPLIEAVTEFLMDNGFGLVDLRVFGVRSSRAAVQANAFFVRQELQRERERAVERVFRSINRISLVV
jgi:FkbM family methyltransferase